MPDLRAAWTFNRIVDHPISSPLSIKYVGHAREWDSIELSGSLVARDCAVTHKRAGRTLAVATVGRDHQNLRAESVLAVNA